MSRFPLHTVETADSPIHSTRMTPPEGEIWIRIKAANAPEMADIMQGVSDLYRKATHFKKPITVINWVGNRPWARTRYPDPISPGGMTAPSF